MFSKGAANTNFIDLGMTRPWPEPTIYSTWGKQANHYTTDVVKKYTDPNSYYSEKLKQY